MLALHMQYSENPTPNDSILVTGHTSVQHPMTKKEMQELLQLGKQSFHTFFTDMTTAGFLLQKEDKSFVLDNSLFIRGKLPRGHYIPTSRVFIRSYTELYQANAQRAKTLGVVLKLAPFLNRLHNILCHNPNETDISRIRPLTFTNICELLGRSICNSTRYRKSLEQQFLQIHFDLHGLCQSFCRIDKAGTHYVLRVNPNVLYVESSENQQQLLSAHWIQQVAPLDAVLFQNRMIDAIA